MTIPESVTRIRQQHSAMIEQAQREVEQKQARSLEFQRWKVNNVLGSIHAYIDRRLSESFGLGDWVWIPMEATYNFICDECGEDAATIRQMVEECSGIRFVYVDEEELEVDLRQGKKCCVESGAEQVKTLDFGALHSKNVERNRAWKELRDKLAVSILDKCTEYLECHSDTLGDNLMYGVPDALSLGLFVETLEFCGGVAKYKELTGGQLKYLQCKMNSMSHYVNFRLTLRETGFVVTAEKAPDNVNRGAYFDYEGFCRKYDTVVAPELWELFGKICKELKFASAEEQLSVLRPIRRLRCTIRGERYFHGSKAGLKRREQDLTRAIEAAFPGIRVTEIICNQFDCASEFALAVHYEILDDDSECLREQVAVEQEIAKIKAEKIDDIAAKIVERIAEYAQSRLYESCKWRKEVANKGYGWQGMIAEMLKFEGDESLVGETELFNEQNISVNIGSSKDEGWFGLIEQVIKDATDGEVLVDLEKRQFRLVCPFR